MRRYSPEEKAHAVRLVRQLRKELGTSQGTVKRVAEQLSYDVESVRMWVKRARIDSGERLHRARGRDGRGSKAKW